MNQTFIGCLDNELKTQPSKNMPIISKRQENHMSHSKHLLTK